MTDVVRTGGAQNAAGCAPAARQRYCAMNNDQRAHTAVNARKWRQMCLDNVNIGATRARALRVTCAGQTGG